MTGGGRGIGRAHCLLLASRGAKVLVNNRTPEKADEVVAEIIAAGGVAVADYNDVASAGAAITAHAAELCTQRPTARCSQRPSAPPHRPHRRHLTSCIYPSSKRATAN